MTEKRKLHKGRASCLFDTAVFRTQYNACYRVKVNKCCPK
jgi:hypothetical protein